MAKTPKVKVLTGTNGMMWTEHKKPTLHWTSDFPSGYFIVEEDADDRDEKDYVVNEGSYGDWFHNTGTLPTEIERHDTIDDATQFTP